MAAFSIKRSPKKRSPIDLPKELEGLDDIDDAMDLAESWGVNMAHCKTQQEIQDRLRYHWMKKEGKMKDLVQVRIITIISASNNI